MSKPNKLHPHEPRKAVKLFAAIMERELQENDYKGGWQDLPKEVLYKMLLGEIAELGEALFSPHYGPDDIASEAGDVANILLFLVDNLGMLGTEHDTRGRKINR